MPDNAVRTLEKVGEQEIVKTPEEVTITNNAVTPKDQGNTAAVDTGDHSNIMYMALLMMIAITGLAVLALRKKHNS